MSAAAVQQIARLARGTSALARHPLACRPSLARLLHTRPGLSASIAHTILPPPAAAAAATTTAPSYHRHLMPPPGFLLSKREAKLAVQRITQLRTRRFGPPPSSPSPPQQQQQQQMSGQPPQPASSLSHSLVLFGRTLVREHLARGCPIDQLYLTADCQLDLAGVPRATEVCRITLDDLHRASGLECTPSDGCAAIVPLPAASRSVELDGAAFSSAAGPRRTLVLDGLADPGNVGTLMRAAEAFAFDHVILIGPGACDPHGEKALRASMGAAARIRLTRATEDQFLCAWKQRVPTTADKEGMLPQLIVCDASSEKSVPLHQWRVPIVAAPASSSSSAAPPAAALCLVIGNEARGVRSSLRQLADTSIRIPMSNHVESLNAAVAGSIVMQHIHGQQLAAAAST